MSRPPHDCSKHPEPTYACYALCKCRCYGCAQIRSEYERNRQRQKAYGRWEPYVDAEPVRRHVRSLMASRRVGATNGVGWKRIAREAGVANGVMTKLLYGDPQRGMEPSKRIRPENARKLLAVGREALADGATTNARTTWRLVDELLAGGFAKAELGRYLTGNPQTRSLQVGRTAVTVGHARTIAELHRQWKVGQIVPRGRRSRWSDELAPTEPLPALSEVARDTCEDCGAETLAGGRWCLPCFRAQAKRAA